MAYIHALHDVFPERLPDIVEQMKRLGAPEVRAYRDGDRWLALEGTHRLAAAEVLGLAPIIIEVRDDDVFPHDIDCVDKDVTVREMLIAMSAGCFWEADSYWVDDSLDLSEMVLSD